MENKKQLRTRILRERTELKPEIARENSRIICGKLFKSSWYQAAEAVFVYAAVRGEVSLRPFVQKTWEDGKKTFFPRVFGEQMEFFEVENEKDLQPGSFGVLEPAKEKNLLSGRQYLSGRREQQPQNAGVQFQRTVILVPGVVYSEKGDRIGYGKGYYDRYLAGHPGLVPIGIAHDLQVVPRLEREAFDVAMTQIITEQREVNCNDRAGNIM